MNIKKQIRNLYFYEIVSGLRLTDVVWVYFLLQRGFSLAEAGIAEGVFHGVSMCCEIPSGMVSDTVGRRKTLILSGIVSAISSLCMFSANRFSLILVAMGLNALSYNLISGTREALTYDSLLMAGEEQRYLKVAAMQESIYNGLNAAASLMSILTVALGYRKTYLLAVLQGMLSAWAAVRLQEAETENKAFQDSLSFRIAGREMRQHFTQSFYFLVKQSAVRKRMMISGSVSTGCYLVFMFMQEHLVETGLEARFIGIPLLILSLFSMAGAFLGARTETINLSAMVFTGGTAIGILLAFSGVENIYGAVAAAGFAHGIGEMLLLRLENENQKSFSSKNRATMISVESMVYSISMMILSPVTGWMAKQMSITAAFVALGILTACMVCGLAAGCNMQEKKASDKKRKDTRNLDEKLL